MLQNTKQPKILVKVCLIFVLFRSSVLFSNLKKKFGWAVGSDFFRKLMNTLSM